MTRRDWPAIVERAASIVRSYEGAITLRMLFYRLVSDGTLPNTSSAYKQLSAATAEARRAGTFPPLVDQTREIHRPYFAESAADALEETLTIFRVDRTRGQPFNVYCGVEKDTQRSLLTSWFGERGVPVVVLRGYASQSYADVVRADKARSIRPSVLIYAGDLDPSGEDIDRDFVARVGGFDHVVRIAVTRDQIDAYHLPPQPGKESDARAARFVERHGELVQVEIEALPPDVLRQLYTEALDRFWDASAFDRAMREERGERERLQRFAATWGAS